MENKKDIEKLNVKQEDLFAVPEGFFDELEDQILSKTIRSAKAPKVIPMYRKPWFWSVAASLLIGAGVLFYFNITKNTSVDTPASDYLANISSEEIATYLKENESYAGNEILDYAEYYNVPVNSSENLQLDVSNEALIEELSDLDLEDIDI